MKTKVFGNGWTPPPRECYIRIFLVISWNGRLLLMREMQFSCDFSLLDMKYPQAAISRPLPVLSFIFDFILFLSSRISLSSINFAFFFFFAKWKWYKLVRPQWSGSSFTKRCAYSDAHFAWTYLTGYKIAGEKRWKCLNILIFEWNSERLIWKIVVVI